MQPRSERFSISTWNWKTAKSPEFVKAKTDAFDLCDSDFEGV
jgi:hypothetical protein